MRFDNERLLVAACRIHSRRDIRRGHHRNMDTSQRQDLAMSVSLTVVIPTIPPRAQFLDRALKSVRAQTQLPSDVVFCVDEDHDGAAATRNRALGQANTKWVAFLDDDDWFHPQHLDHLLVCAERTDADLVYPWFTTNGTDPLFIDFERAAMRPFDDKARDWLINRGNFIPITTLVRREALMDVGGFSMPPQADPGNPCEDWGAWRLLALADAKFIHLPECTWEWNHWYGNTSGRPWWQ